MYRNITVNLQNKHWINRLSRADGANTTTTTTTTTVRNRSKQNGSQSWFNTHSQISNNSPSNSFLQMTLFVLTTTARGDAYYAENRIWQHPPARTHTHKQTFVFHCLFFRAKDGAFSKREAFTFKKVQRTFYVSGSLARDGSTNTHTNRQNKAQNCASF